MGRVARLSHGTPWDTGVSAARSLQISRGVGWYTP